MYSYFVIFNFDNFFERNIYKIRLLFEGIYSLLISLVYLLIFLKGMIFLYY